MRNLILIVAFFTVSLSSYSQSANSLKFSESNFEKIVIPYTMVGDKMIVKVEINGSNENFVFDTGGQLIVTEELQKKLQLKMADSIKVTDATLTKKIGQTIISKLNFEGSKIEFNNLQSILLGADTKWLKCFDSQGTIGNDFLNHFIVEIDSKKNEITLYPPTKIIDISLRNMVKFESNKMNRPIITLGLDNGNQVSALFDTGAGKFLGLSKADYQKLKSTGGLLFVSKGTGGSAVGVSGFSAKQASKFRYSVPLITVGLAKFNNLVSETRFSQQNLIGCDLINYGKVTIDYFRSRFYFEPFEKLPTDLMKKQWDFDFSVNNGTILLGSLWGDLVNQAELGAEVLKVNNIDVDKIEWCDAVVNGFPQLKDKTKVTLTFKCSDGIHTLTTEKK